MYRKTRSCDGGDVVGGGLSFRLIFLSGVKLEGDMLSEHHVIGNPFCLETNLSVFFGLILFGCLCCKVRLCWFFVCVFVSFIQTLFS